MNETDRNENNRPKSDSPATGSFEDFANQIGREGKNKSFDNSLTCGHCHVPVWNGSGPRPEGEPCERGEPHQYDPAWPGWQGGQCQLWIPASSYEHWNETETVYQTYYQKWKAQRGG